MADTADLVVLGAYYGTGNKGGMRSVFLMGAYNEKLARWQTVTKVATDWTTPHWTRCKVRSPWSRSRRSPIWCPTGST